jgi:hypothetical protein
MKKLIASLLVLVFGATMVMAEVPTVTANSEQVVASTAIGTPSADLAFADVEGAPLGEAESADVMGGYDPDAGGNNWKYTVHNVERVAKYLSQKRKVTVSVSLEASLSSPSVKVGYDITPPRGPYVSGSVGPVTVNIKF